MNNKARKFYDNFLSTLNQDGEEGNLRHRHVIERFDQFFEAGEKILDLGCGLGITTSALIKQGKKAVGVDFSNSLIEEAKKRHGNHFICHDVLSFNYGEKFDGISLIDCIEHFPKKEVNKIFQVIDKHSKSGTKVFINIPHNKYQQFISRSRKDLLQIIDEAIPTSFVVSEMEKLGFELKFFKTYGLWEVKDFNYAEYLFVKFDSLLDKELFSCLEK